jgi:hypothetical protein
MLILILFCTVHPCGATALDTTTTVQTELRVQFFPFFLSLFFGNDFSCLLDTNVDTLTRETTTNRNSLKDLFLLFDEYGGTARNFLNESSLERN